MIRVIDGEKFEVVFDGKQSLLRDYSCASTLSRAGDDATGSMARMTKDETQKFYRKHGQSYFNNHRAEKRMRLANR